MFSKKSTITLLTIAIIGMSVLVPGCTGVAPGGTHATDSASPGTQISGKAQVTGSTSVAPYAEELGAAFEEKYPSTSIGISSTGSGPGIKATIDGTTDIGMSSRELTPEEEAQGLKSIVIAYDGIAIIVNKNNPVASLTSEQIKEVYSGNITNWKQVGGNDAAIIVVTRESSSGTRSAFEELVMQKKVNITASAIQQPSTGSVTTYVAGNKNAIGYVSYGSLNDGDNIKAVMVDGVAPSIESIKNGSYRIQRPFLYVTKGEPGNAVAEAFIDYTLSVEGQEILAKHHLVTV